MSEFEERFLNIMKQCKNRKDYNGKKKGVQLIFTDLKPSTTGMSRTFKVYVTTKQGDLLNVTYIIAKMLKDTYTSDGKIRVYGCGMDMLFDLCYRINVHFWYSVKKHKKYNHNFSYHGIVNTSYDLL